MQEVILSKSPVNTPVLDAALREALGAPYQGMSTRLGEVMVFLEDNASSQDIQAAQVIVANHDANTLSPEQEAEAARQIALAAAREAHPNGLDMSQFESSGTEIQDLASYVAWLELEVRALRGL